MYPLQCCETNGRINVMEIFSIWPFHFSRHIYGGRCCRGHRFRYFPMETIHPHWSLLGELLTSPNTASMWTFFVMTTVCDLRVLSVQMADAMEMMILSILAPQLHCEWRLLSLEVALLTSVMVLLTSAPKRACCIKICHYRSFFISTGCVYWDDDQLFSLGKHIW